MKQIIIRMWVIFTLVLLCFFATLALSQLIGDIMEIPIFTVFAYALSLGTCSFIGFLTLVYFLFKKAGREDFIFAIFFPILSVFLLIASIMYLNSGLIMHAMLGFLLVTISIFGSIDASRQYSIHKNKKSKILIVNQMLGFTFLFIPMICLY